MRVYCAVAVRDRDRDASRDRPDRRLEAALRAARRQVRRALPAPPDEVREQCWVAPDGGRALVGWSNEPDHPLLPPILTVQDDRAFGFTGNLTDPADAARLLAAPDLLAASTTTGGCWSLFRAGHDRVEAVTAVTAVDPVYLASGPHVQVLAGRALLAHLVARADLTGTDDPAPELELVRLHPLVRHGFFLDDRTVFVGTRALPGAARAAVQDGRLRLDQAWPDAVEQKVRPARYRSLLDDAADALTRAVGPLALHDRPAELPLTGGRDSRLLAAALHSAGVPFRAFVRGFDRTADVVVARQVAAALDVPLSVRRPVHPSTDTVPVEHPWDRAVRVLDLADGMNLAKDNLPSYGSFTVAPALSGSGGEVLRGGYLPDQPDMSPKAVRRRVELMFLSAERYLVGAANDEARAALGPWLALARQAPHTTLHQLYLRFRCGRWLPGQRAGVLLRQSYHHPLADNLVVRACAGMPARALWSEQPVHDLISALAPAVRDLPLDKRRWRYEADGPVRGSAPGWERRQAVLSPPGRNSFDPVVQPGPEVLAILRDGILHGPGSEPLGALIRRDTVEGTLALDRDRLDNTTLRLYTLAVLLDGAWLEAPRRPLHPQPEVPVPPAGTLPAPAAAAVGPTAPGSASAGPVVTAAPDHPQPGPRSRRGRLRLLRRHPG